MAGSVRKGERIPRRQLPEFDEAGSLAKGLTRDGLFRTAMDDSNEYGPQAMIILLIITASLTGGLLLLLR
ncbi:MAG: hypothetical protein QGI21_02810 [Candidatus Poseidoniaceae archaeon]|nr:hypothetical protein [Candidatus Poseidoniaceae archaeon]